MKNKSKTRPGSKDHFRRSKFTSDNDRVAGGTILNINVERMYDDDGLTAKESVRSASKRERKSLIDPIIALHTKEGIFMNHHMPL